MESYGFSRIESNIGFNVIFKKMLIKKKYQRGRLEKSKLVKLRG